MNIRVYRSKQHKIETLDIEDYLCGVVPSEIGRNAPFEAMKAQRITQGMIKLGADYVYPISILKPQFEEIKKRLHDNGMKFYSGENRLRKMGDNLCCCGIEGMGWKVNTANLNHYLYDKENYQFTEAQKAPEGGMAFQSLAQRASTRGLTHLSYERCMEMCVSTKSYIETLMPTK